jgi:hypothetical protein
LFLLAHHLFTTVASNSTYNITHDKIVHISLFKYHSSIVIFIEFVTINVQILMTSLDDKKDRSPAGLTGDLSDKKKIEQAIAVLSVKYEGKPIDLSKATKGDSRQEMAEKASLVCSSCGKKAYPYRTCYSDHKILSFCSKECEFSCEKEIHL